MSIDYQGIQEHLKALEAQRADLIAKAAEMRAEAAEQMVGNVIKYIEDNGFGVREICTKVLSSVTQHRASTTYYNPDNPEQTYSRGPLAEWIKEKMVAANLDPSDKAAVAAFKKTLPSK